MSATTKRIAAKRAREMVAAVLTLPMVLDHAKASLWRLDSGTARLYVYQTAWQELAGFRSRRHVKRAVWRAWPRIWQDAGRAA